jgi:hypothetical protein
MFIWTFLITKTLEITSCSYALKSWNTLYIVARMWRLYETGLDWQLDLLDTLTVTINYSVYTLHSQFTIVLVESSYCVFTGCPPSNTVGSVHLQLFSEDCCFTVVLTRLALQDWLTLGPITNSSVFWRLALCNSLDSLTDSAHLYSMAGPLLSHVMLTARASAILFTSLS